ncbi:hypothetical protein SEA_RUDY_63 [Microbacterium phage Rudy]|nr:hypothetical protein SEA_CASEND_66 [Microbacterium phage Casend]QQO39245.1 hypothetical protein SEA_RUDY_63 [Microbacterium phage Rudy]QQO39574.1 hypothetical protein SEA_PHABIA_65 [Microbacterium phage Phabia]QWY80449.1 membrane protein [Microbacterium phage Teehee]QXN73460.1 hypothetical protein SEA_JEHOSHAPHAT_67 [Microbacterium phage Jehoshaphat]WNM75584.1 hypothetical protein SEA_WAYNE3_67 [Microbacterium phage Wayne3]
MMGRSEKVGVITGLILLGVLITLYVWIGVGRS